MANPTPYTVSYSFSGFQATNPTTPLPAGSLDNELANIVASVAALISALQDVRRSDGALKSGIVTLDSFASGLQLMVDPTNGNLVAAAVATAQAAQAAASGSATAAATSATNALNQAIAAAASANTVNLSLYLAKANNLAGLGSQLTSRQNLGLGTSSTFDVGALANNIVQLDANAKIPAYDGSQLINIDTLPVGTTIWTNANSAPTGFLKENGALISRTSFPRLWTFALISNNLVTEAAWSGGSSGAFSTGDLATTFRLMDSRGEFIRAYDDSRGVDSGRSIGVHQADALRDHTHTLPIVNSSTNAGGGGGSMLANGSGLVTGSANIGAAETRPRNNAKLACIKF